MSEEKRDAKFLLDRIRASIALWPMEYPEAYDALRAEVEQLKGACVELQVLLDNALVLLRAAAEGATCSDVVAIDTSCRCQACGEHFREDVMLPDEMWNEIRPKGKPPGGGLLCGRCIGLLMYGRLRLAQDRFTEILEACGRADARAAAAEAQLAALRRGLSMLNGECPQCRTADPCSDPRCQIVLLLLGKPTRYASEELRAALSAPAQLAAEMRMPRDWKHTEKCMRGVSKDKCICWPASQPTATAAPSEDRSLLCGHVVSAGARTCPVCGAPAEPAADEPTPSGEEAPSPKLHAKSAANPDWPYEHRCVACGEEWPCTASGGGKE